ncbi:hypothetical protein BDW22DRAFT_151268 [Trametopsis cervina]|nr:hypothetical protein BDW22DRAFT_151268 [Trametopsis cervina]
MDSALYSSPLELAFRASEPVHSLIPPLLSLGASRATHPCKLQDFGHSLSFLHQAQLRAAARPHSLRFRCAICLPFAISPSVDPGCVLAPSLPLLAWYCLFNDTMLYPLMRTDNKCYFGWPFRKYCSMKWRVSGDTRGSGASRLQIAKSKQASVNHHAIPRAAIINGKYPLQGCSVCDDAVCVSKFMRMV